MAAQQAESSFDVIVVGAGIMGSCAAHAAASRGARVLLLEQFDLLHQRGSSHGESRTIRATYPQPHYPPMVRLSRRLWDDAQRDSGRRNDDDRGENIERRGVPRRQVHHHGGRVDEQAGQVRHRRRAARAAAAHPHLLLEGEARPRARADDGGRLPDVRELRLPLHLQHAVDGVPGADQDRHARRATVRPGRPGLGHRPGGGRAGGARGAVDRRGDAGPRGDRGRAGDPAGVHVLHDPRRGLRDRLPGRGGVREGRGGRRRVLRARVQDGPGGGEDPGGDGAGRRGADRGGGRRGAPALQHRAVRRQPDGERQEFVRHGWMFA